jgi:hypothetical protein
LGTAPPARVPRPAATMSAAIFGVDAIARPL